MEAQRCEETARAAKEFGHAASLLAAEAARLASLCGHDPQAVRVARRASEQAQHAAAELDRLASGAGTMGESYRAATWALSAAAVGLTQAREALESRIPRPRL